MPEASNIGSTVIVFVLSAALCMRQEQASSCFWDPKDHLDVQLSVRASFPSIIVEKLQEIFDDLRSGAMFELVATYPQPWF